MGNEIQQFYKDFTRYGQKLAKESPDMSKSIKALHDGVMKKGVLTRKEKEFISIGIAIAAHCPPCIRLHTQSAVAAGASKEEIIEAASVACVLAGGIAYTHIPEVMKTLEAMGVA